ncbi:hypothetical protein FKP32DRAFT_1602220 [Trametes sanguinea]|nr:hypothetical protein FKP32DRAFT_1602220 [Trametes sanguinea]
MSQTVPTDLDIGVLASPQRKRKERELSPAVPDPDPTPSRADAFWTTPNRSARVKRTYAHKRARPYTSSAHERSDGDGNVLVSKVKYESMSIRRRSAAVDVYVDVPRSDELEYLNATTRVASPRLDLTANGDPGPSTAPSEPLHKENARVPRKRLVPYVEITHRPELMRKATYISEATAPTRMDDIPDSSSHPSRGPPLEQNAIAFPSPPPSEDNWAVGRAAHRQDEQLTLSEALNRSFATASSHSAAFGIDNVPGSSHDLPKRKPGRSRSRGRGLVATTSIATYNESTSTRLPKEGGDNAAPVTAPPVKRGRGRPRKHPLPASAAEPEPMRATVSRRSSARSKSRTRAAQSPTDEDDGDAAAVVDQLLLDASSSPTRASNISPTRHDYAYDSVDVNPIARAFERQAQEEAAVASDWDAVPTPKRPRGRPRGSKNKSTLAREAEAQAHAQAQARAKPPSGPRTRSRGRSSTRRNSISAVLDASSAHPAASSQYYLDLDTMQWRRRARSISASPAKRRRSSSRPGRVRKPTEYPTGKALFAALKATLAAASMKPKLGQARTEDGLRIAPSGVLLLSTGADDEDPGDEMTSVFHGSWAVLEDPRVAIDDALVMKRLHEVVLGIGGFIRLEHAHISHTSGGRTVTVAVPCCCQTVQPDNPQHTAWAARAAAEPVECEGELAVSVSEQPTREFAGLAKVLRTTVTVTH